MCVCVCVCYPNSIVSAHSDRGLSLQLILLTSSEVTKEKVS